MEFFRSLLRAIGLYEPTKVDFVGHLPVEVSQLIFRKLDPESILNVVQVSRKWKDTCQCDPVLRRQVREYLKKEEPAEESEAVHLPRQTMKRRPVTRPVHVEPRHVRFVSVDARKALGSLAHGPSAVSDVSRRRTCSRTNGRSGGSRTRGFRI